MFSLTPHLVHACVQRLVDGRDCAAVAATLRAAGAVPDAHVALIRLGAVRLSDRQRLEWYAGRLLACIDDAQWFALGRAVRGCETCTGIAVAAVPVSAAAASEPFAAGAESVRSA